MTWVKLDDQFMRNPKIVAAGRDARDLYLAGLCYSAGNLTDGLIPRNALRMLAADADIDEVGEAAETLVSVGLWDETVDSFTVHDYLEYNPSADKVKAERASNAKRQAEWRERKQEERALRERESQGNNTVSNTVTNEHVTGAPSRPVPSPSLGDKSPNTPSGDEPTKPKRKTTRRGPTAPIPSDFVLTPERLTVALDEGLSKSQAEHEFRKFQSHAKATDRRMVDWEATWRTWVLKSLDDKPNRPGALTIHQGGRAGGECVGKDGLTDSERGWREDPGHKGWSADEMMRMAIAMERADNERNSA